MILIRVLTAAGCINHSALYLSTQPLFVLFENAQFHLFPLRPPSLFSVIHVLVQNFMTFLDSIRKSGKKSANHQGTRKSHASKPAANLTSSKSSHLISSKHWCHGHHGPLKASPGAIIAHHATETDCSYAVISNVDGH